MHCHIGGWILIILGSLFLLHNLGILPHHILSKGWPLILIVVGVGILWKKHRNTPKQM